MSESTHEKLKAFELSWDSLEVVIGGKSPIDASSWFQINTLEQAEAFLESYGFNYQDPITQAELYGHLQESINFIRKFFLYPENPTGVRDEIPPELLSLSDFRKLFVLASQPNKHNADIIRTVANDPWSKEGERIRHWSGALLKILHTIAHIDKDIRVTYFTEIQKQILDRFYRHIHRNEHDELVLQSKNESIVLHAFDTKPKKTRDSIILKLLQKPENVAEDIFDRIGIRLVTKNRLDILKTIDFLIRNHVVMPANVKPSRSKNNLIDLMKSQKSFNDFELLIREGKKRPRDFNLAFDELIGDYPELTLTKNIHTSPDYRAVQFTCRQLITYQNPIFTDILEIRENLRKCEEENLPGLENSLHFKKALSVAESLDTGKIRREIQFFYPYEIQIVDEASNLVNLKGEGAHRDYKQSQLNSALRRVMGPLA